MKIASGTELAEKVEKVLIDGEEVYALNVDTEAGVAEVYLPDSATAVRVEGNIEIVWKENNE